MGALWGHCRAQQPRGEQENNFSSEIRSASPGQRMAHAAGIAAPGLQLNIKFSSTRATGKAAIMFYRENHFPACRLIFNLSNFFLPLSPPLAIVPPFLSKSLLICLSDRAKQGELKRKSI